MDDFGAPGGVEGVLVPVGSVHHTVAAPEIVSIRGRCSGIVPSTSLSPGPAGEADDRMVVYGRYFGERGAII
ncbi:hypothetical protein KPHES18087_20840 [Corynebacterium ulcerans]